MPVERVAKGPQTSVIASRNDHMKANAHERSWVGKGNTSAWGMQRHQVLLVFVAERRRRRSSVGICTTGSCVVSITLKRYVGDMLWEVTAEVRCWDRDVECAIQT